MSERKASTETRERTLPEDKLDWPCPTCGKLLREHGDELGRCYLVSLLKSVLGEGVGWNIQVAESGKTR